MAVSFVVDRRAHAGQTERPPVGRTNPTPRCWSVQPGRQAIIVAAAIVASEGGLGEGLICTIVYALIGLAVMALAFVLVDLLTPGSSVGSCWRTHPAVWVHAALHVAIGVIVAIVDPVVSSDVGSPGFGPGRRATSHLNRRGVARGRGFARAALLAVVFVCAACGLVYELALVSLGSYLIGNTARGPRSCCR